MKIKKHLSFSSLIGCFKKAFCDYKDQRKETSTSYPALDTALSGLACMFYKSSTMVNFQESMENLRVQSSSEDFCKI
jgi:hypothetical protein